MINLFRKWFLSSKFFDDQEKLRNSMWEAQGLPVIKMENAYRHYRKQTNKLPIEMTKLDKQIALLNETLRRLGD